MAEIPNRTLGRGLKMLELLAEKPEGLALYELAQALTLPRSTAFNLARTLTDLNYLSFDPATNRYALGFKMFEVGSAAIHRMDTLSMVRGYMKEVYRQINQTMHLGIRSERDILYIDKLDCTHSAPMTSYVGYRQPLYATALGTAILAGMTNEQVKSLYRRTTFQAITPRTLPSLEALLERLALIRERGYAIERDESVEGISCAAVAFKNENGHPLYAISVSLPSPRVDEMDLERYGRLLLKIPAKFRT